MGRQGALSCAKLLGTLALVSCSQSARELPPYGEVLVQVDTNVRVPRLVSRVRVDVFDSDRHWLSSRDMATPSATDFPLSFSLYNEANDAPRGAWLRVRGYLDGHLRDYLGERFAEPPRFEQPSVSASLQQACADAPPLPMFEPTGLRLRGEQFTEAGAQLSCVSSSGRATKRTHSGLAVYKLTIDSPGTYRVAVVGAQPGAEWAAVADTVMVLRRDCEAAASEIVCNDDERSELGNLSGVHHDLTEGDYYVLVGTVGQGPMDLMVLAEPELGFSTEPMLGPGDFVNGGPRLVVDGSDITPPSEPDPSLAIDRLLRVDVAPTQQQTARVLLDGACLGTMADLSGARSCVDTEGVLTDVAAEALVSGRARGGESAVGSWAEYRKQGCPEDSSTTQRARHTERVCVPGGTFLLGDPTLIARGADAGTPERLAAIPTFVMDRYEYTVARYRSALARGFEPPDGGPLNTPIKLEEDGIYSACTWNELSGGGVAFPAQEDLPLSCVSWLTARALCEFEGGRLPGVAEREYAASASGRAVETTYPWGETLPSCDQAVFGRWLEPSRGSTACLAATSARGPSPVGAEPFASFDRTPDGVVGLGGNVAEWTLDSHRAYSDACWQSQPHLAPACNEDEAPLRTIAGGSWRSLAAGTRAASRVGGAVAGFDPWVGFRCIYPVKP